MQGDVLLIVPPFASLWYPSLAVHLLQACADRAGFRTDVLYVNLMFASVIGDEAYEQIAGQSIAFASERLFARAAFDLPPLGHGAEHIFDPRRIFGDAQGELYRGLVPDGRAATRGMVSRPITVSQLRALEAGVPGWLDSLAARIVSLGYKVVGCTTTYQQTNASIALLNRVKLLAPEVVTVLGGANCESDMAQGLLSLGTQVDYIFEGESERAFPAFVRSVFDGTLPESRIVHGSPCTDLDALPMLSFEEYFDQRARYMRTPSLEATYITYETSRGCWWGEKQHCTFCGLNGSGMTFRRKSPTRILDELRVLLSDSPTKNVSITDNIMPREYLKTLMPHLQRVVPGINIFYEQKSNLSFWDVAALKSAGVNAIQPGIEALSSSLLKLMKKGVNARQHLQLLRYGRILGMELVWNLICGFPNDELESYRETMDVVPLILHLQPPSGLWHLSIDRFSPYFVHPQRHNLTNLRPLPVYHDFLPEEADIDKIAYRFLADYPSDTHRFIADVKKLADQVRAWAVAWDQSHDRRPELKLCEHRGRLVLVDTRGLSDAPKLREVDAAEASILLTARPCQGCQEEEAAVARRLAVVVDGWFVPLPVARQDLFLRLSGERRTRAPTRQLRLGPQDVPSALHEESG